MLLNDYLLQVGLWLSSDQQDKLFQHITLLEEWNQHINMTSIKKNEMLHRHILDSLSITSLLMSFHRVADMGTGAGFPGIPLAIACPENHYTLIEANDKKCGFLRHVVKVLDLSNVQVVHARIENFLPTHGFDALVCRALSSPQKVYNLSIHLLKEKGKIFVMAANKHHQDWQVEGVVKKEQWRIYPLPPIAHLGKRYLLEYSQ